jgi:hypothetical protein
VDVSPVTTTTIEVVLGPEYDSFNGDFSYEDGRGFSTFVSLDGDTAEVTCVTMNATVYFRYTIILHDGTITTCMKEYPIIWYFECIDYPYRWDDADTLVVTDPVNSRVLTLRRG